MASTDSPTSVSSATASRILRFWLDDSKNGKSRRHAFFLKPECIFVIVASFTLITGIFLKNKIATTFSKEYNELVNSELSQNVMVGGGIKTFQNLRAFESEINSSFETIIFSSFALILISVAIIQFRYSKQKRQLELLREHEETQKSFSRDLHDTVAQSLSVLKIAVESGDKEKALYWADKSILETRELISSLRLDLSKDFVSIVKDYAKTFESNFCIQTQVFEATKLAASFDSKTKEEFLRILQESLSNVVKHANASKVEIKMLDVANEFVMSINDNGKGFDNAQPEGFDNAQTKDSDVISTGTITNANSSVVEALETATDEECVRQWSTCEAVPKRRWLSSEAKSKPPKRRNERLAKCGTADPKLSENETKGNAQNKTQAHVGLKSMKERAESIGAEFSVKSSSDGTNVFVKMKTR